ncbi:MAG: FG-GAP-like repeat-containing protein [Candidatus Poseidoniaceae archaeon]|jgi:hypothetical protein|nr:FG-GAP-like repeat-containing protein [Candidatus Poseidoniaceae archaeon]
MLWRKWVLPLTILMIFAMQILLPLAPLSESESYIPGQSEFFGSGHERAGSQVTINGQSWDIRPESIIEEVEFTTLSSNATGGIDLVPDLDHGVHFCAINGDEVVYVAPDGNQMLIENLSGQEGADHCAIANSDLDRIVVVYDNGDDLKVARLAIESIVYTNPIWYVRTIAEDVVKDTIRVDFDSEHRIHIVYRDLDSKLSHMMYNTAYWNHSIIESDQVGSDVEFEIDDLGIAHVVYTKGDEVHLIRFNETYEVRQTIGKDSNLTNGIGMSLDSNFVEQIAYTTEVNGTSTVSLLQSLAGKDIGRISPEAKWIINYDDDSLEGIVKFGDIDSDGYDDLVYTDPDGNGTISIHVGSSSGPSILADQIIVGSQGDSLLGNAMAVGDWNCDGYDDIVASEHGLGYNDSGYVKIMLGSAEGINESAWWSLQGNDNDNLGWSIASLGDVELDGCDDFAIVANKLVEEHPSDPQLSKNGLVLIFRGNQTSMIHQTNITQTLDGSMFGRALASGDWDGDGYNDLVISNTGNQDSPTGYSSIEFFRGGPNGTESTPYADFQLLTQGKLYGTEMSFVGDINGDGYEDLLISELYASGNLYHTGKIHLWAGSSTGPTQGYWDDTGAFANALLGTTLSPAGDINEDGYDDFLVTYPRYSNNGNVLLYLGSSFGPRQDTQSFAQGLTGEYVGINLLSGMDFDGDGMGDLLYSSRDLKEDGSSFTPALNIMTERDWEFIDIEIEGSVNNIEMGSTLRGDPTIFVDGQNDVLIRHTLDGSPSGRWVISTIDSSGTVSFASSSSGNFAILSHTNGPIKYHYSTPYLGLTTTLNSINEAGMWADTDVDSNGLQHIVHASTSFSSIFYSNESSTGWTSQTVSSSIDLMMPIQLHLNSSDTPHLVYTEDTGDVKIAIRDSSWSENNLLNSTVGIDLDTVMWDDELYMAVINSVNNTSVLSVIHWANLSDNNYTHNWNLAVVNDTAQVEIGMSDANNLCVSWMDGSRLIVNELNLSAVTWNDTNHWTEVQNIWLLGETEGYNLVQDNSVVVFDANDTSQGMVYKNDEGIWNYHSQEIINSEVPMDLLVSNDRWHLTSTDSNNNIVWSNGLIGTTNNKNSVVFKEFTTEHVIPISINNQGEYVYQFSDSLSKDMVAMRLQKDTDADFYPDSVDAFPTLSNQWIDSDSDGFGDNQDGPYSDMCPSTFGTSHYYEHGCLDADSDGYRDVIDDCVNDKGMSWWGRIGCNDYDQDGWSDNDGTYVGGDRYPTNWKQALDTDRDTYGDNHGPDCCDVVIFGNTDSSEPDLFPYNRAQWKDDDNDGYGDNSSDQEFGDKCPWVQGFSWRDRLGCVDTDGDGASDPSGQGVNEWNVSHGADMWTNDSTQWADTDGDGFGDNSSDGATNPDKFPNNNAAANDSDNDGYPNDWTVQYNGSNAKGLLIDGCPNQYGNSSYPMPGCVDTDGDGTADVIDDFPLDPTQVTDTDEDGWGDNPAGNDPDQCPYVPGLINGTKPDGTPGVGCPIIDANDDDADGVTNEYDECENTDQGLPVDSVGCAENQKDEDQDGVFNSEDLCPNTEFGSTVDNDGCAQEQIEVDTDGDGINDPYDLCPDTDSALTVNAVGCAGNQIDSDGDNVTDDVDDCPGTAQGIPVLANGCDDESLINQNDIDNDGHVGEYSFDINADTGEVENETGDAFPADASQWWDRDGDGYGDNSNGNESDDCPTVFGTSMMKDRYGCLDSDGDGYGDELGHDPFPSDSTQWEDADQDSWGDNQTGDNPDLCLNTTLAKVEQARVNNGCADYQLDSDNDGVTNDRDACPGTEPNAPVYPSGCKMEIEEPVEETSDLIFGMEPTMFYIVSFTGGLFVLLLIIFVIRIRNRTDFYDDDDDDDWEEDYYEDEEEEDFLSTIMNQSRSNRPISNQGRGPPSNSPGPSRGGPSGPPQGTPPRGPARGGPSPKGPPRGRGPGVSSKKKVAKRKPINKVEIDENLFSADDMADRKAAIDWTKSALKDGESERKILMQLQTTGWTAPQSRAIIDLSK